MKSLALALALVSAAPHVSPHVSPPKPVNYSGSWTLDKAHSTGLPTYYDRVRSHDLLITQRGVTLDVAVSIDIGAAAPDRIHLVYTMDGKESRTETPVRGPNGLTQVPTTLRAVVTPDRQVEITIARDVVMGDRAAHVVTTEQWRLAADGRTLTIHRVDDMPRGRVDATMVFVRSTR